MGTILGRLPGNFIHKLPQIKTISGPRCTARRHTSTPDPSLLAPDTLWEKINGETELYRRFHLVRAAYRRYSLPGKPDETLEVGVYLLSPALDAFGLFSFFSPDGAASWPYGKGPSPKGIKGFSGTGPSSSPWTASAKSCSSFRRHCESSPTGSARHLPRFPS